MDKDTTNPSAALMELINGFRVSQAIHVAATLGIADLLKGGPRRSDDLAAATGTHADTLYRLLRALASVGVFREDADRRFSLTPLGDCLRSDAAEPLRSWAVHIGRPEFRAAWDHLLHSVRTGENAWRHLHGTSAWEYRARHPEAGCNIRPSHDGTVTRRAPWSTPMTSPGSRAWSTSREGTVRCLPRF